MSLFKINFIFYLSKKLFFFNNPFFRFPALGIQFKDFSFFNVILLNTFFFNATGLCNSTYAHTHALTH